MPSPQLLAEMGKFNEELVKAGIMLAGDGLHPTSKGSPRAVRRRESHRDRRTICRDEGLVAGYWLWQVKSMDEAVEWLERCRTRTTK